MRTLGQIFRETREAKGLSAAQAAEATRIKPQMLDRMEADVWAQMPAPIYARGFIKIYAECLGLTPEPMIEAYSRWSQSDHRRPPFIGEAEPEASPSVPIQAIPAPRTPEPAPLPRRPVIPSVPPPEDKPPAQAQAAPTPRPPSRPSSSSPRPAFLPSGSVFAGMGRFLKYIPIGLAMVLAIVLLFSALKRWGRFSGHSTPTAPIPAEVRPPVSTGGTPVSPSGVGSSGLVLAEEPPPTYFDDTP
jgi:hypothetical protein